MKSMGRTKRKEPEESDEPAAAEAAPDAEKIVKRRRKKVHRDPKVTVNRTLPLIRRIFRLPRKP